MGLSENINNREFDKFDTDAEGNTIIRTSIKNGVVTPTGLRTGGKITNVELSDSEWRPLPATALPKRNALAIENISSVEIKINYVDNVGYIGKRIKVDGERYYDITDDIVIYGRSSAGLATIQVEEIA
jgi:hypothetical protein